MQQHSGRYFFCYTDKETWPFYVGRNTATFGFGENHLRTAEALLPGDRFVCYLKALKRWCGVLEVINTQPTGQAAPAGIDAKYPVRRPVKILVALSPGDSIPVDNDELWDNLIATRSHSRGTGWITSVGWRQDLAPMAPEDGKLILEALFKRLRMPLAASDADDEPYDPTSDADARAAISRRIRARRGQTAFRNRLFEAYGGVCAMSGCGVADVLEAAHIRPHIGAASNHVTNGLLLRADLHTLFDCGLLGVHPDSMEIRIHASLRNSIYSDFDGMPLRKPLRAGSAPSPKALEHHWQNTFFARNG